MIFGLFMGDWTLIPVFVAMIFTFVAQINVKSTFNKYQNVRNRRSITGAEAARKILDANGLSHTSVERVSGELTDHYDPRADIIRLSDSVYSSTSAAAVGIAAHEAGHAIQHAQKYFPIKIRAAIIPITNLGSKLSMPLFLIGSILAYATAIPSPLATPLMLAGIICFSFSTLFQLVTLPTEFNASARAMATLRGSAMLDTGELKAARKVLTAAALTYVAALAYSLIYLLRLILIFNGNRRR
ncbi:MAG: zinc metallopeptidase [Ruminococcaceae bacterium]|nr:zinc metallopeptidase [Oscillospiraceae bacterium]